MSNTTQKLAAFILMGSLLGSLPNKAESSQLQNAMNSMFTATTSPQTFSTPSMSGVAFGSFSARFPIQNFNIIAFDPPRLNAGCSGIDMYMGSFSFINAEQFKAMLRAVAQGVVGYAFKMAIRTICAPCEATLSDLQDIIQKLNAMGKNTCAISKMTADYLFDKSGVKEKSENSDSLLKSAKGVVDGWWEGFNEARRNSRSGDRSNQYAGNLTYRALHNSYAGDEFGGSGASVYYGMTGDVNDLIMNLVGTRILHTGSNHLKTCNAGDSGDCEKPPTVIVGNLTFEHILHGRHAGGERVSFYRCDTRNSEKDSQNPTRTYFTFEGTQRYVQRMIFGENGSALSPASDSIMGTLLRSGVAGLSQTQKNFLGSVKSIPLMSIIYRTQRDRSVAQGILVRAIDTVAHEMTFKIISEAIRVTKTAFSQNTVTMPQDMSDKIASLEADIAKKGHEKPSEMLQALNAINTLVEAHIRAYPKADITSWLK